MKSLLSKEGVLERIRHMDPYEFEELVSKLWERRGFSVNVRKGSGDRGIDFEAYKNTGLDSKIKQFIQVKRYSSNNKLEVNKYVNMQLYISRRTALIALSY